MQYFYTQTHGNILRKCARPRSSFCIDLRICFRVTIFYMLASHRIDKSPNLLLLALLGFYFLRSPKAPCSDNASISILLSESPYILYVSDFCIPLSACISRAIIASLLVALVLFLSLSIYGRNFQVVFFMVSYLLSHPSP